MAPPAKSMGASVAFAASGNDWLASKPTAVCGDEGARPICRLPPVESVGAGLKDDGTGDRLREQGGLGGSDPVCGLPEKSAVTVSRGAVTLSLAVKRVPEP